MPIKDQSKIVLVLFATLLKSNWSDAELRRIAIELDDGTLGSDLARAIFGFISATEGGPSPKRVQSGYRGQDSGLTGKILDAIKRKRLSKFEVLNAMTASGGVRLSTTDGPIKELVTRYLQLSTDSEIQDFVARIIGPGSADPFLKGISNR